MLLWSNQWKIVNDISLSFQKNKKIHTKISGGTLERDRIFLNPDKYSSYTESDFKFLVLWTCLTISNSKIDTLKSLQRYDIQNKKDINTQKSKIIYHMNTLNEDIQTMNTYIMTPSLAQKLYNTKEISFIGAWWYLRDITPKGRIQTKFKQRLDYFMSYFDKVKENLNTVKEKDE